MKPRLLDLFCCEGGAARGYQEAGFHVTGVDIEARYAKRYVGDEFIHADAVEYARAHAHEYDAVHASPPCQAYSIATVGTKGARDKHPRLIEPVREALQASGKPYVIENVVGAPLRSPLLLCGSMFGITAVDVDGTLLRLERHRLFESNVFLLPPGECRHDPAVPVGGVYGGGRSDRHEARFVRRGGYTPSKRVREALIGADWMTLHGLSQSIPPAYTRWLGEQLVEALQAAEAHA